MLEKCPSCGSKLVFDPRTHSMVCPNCGMVIEESRLALEEELNYSPSLAEALEEYELKLKKSPVNDRRIAWLETIYGEKSRRLIGRVKSSVAEALKYKSPGIERLLAGKNFRNFQELEDFLVEKLPEVPLSEIVKALEEAYSKYGVTRKPSPSKEALAKRTKEKALLMESRSEEVASALEGEAKEIFYLLKSTGLFSGVDARVLQLAIMKAYLNMPLTESEFRRMKSRGALRGKLSTVMKKIERLKALPAPVLALRFGLTLKQAALIKGVRPDTAWREAYLFRRRYPGFKRVDEFSLAKVYDSYSRYKEVCELLNLNPLTRKEFESLKRRPNLLRLEVRTDKEKEKDVRFGLWLQEGYGSWLLRR